MALGIFSLSIKVDKDNSSGEINTLSIGFAFHAAWMLSALSPLYCSVGQSWPIASFCMLASCAVALLFCMSTDQMLLSLYVSKKTLVVASLLASVGSLGLQPFLPFGVPALALLGTCAGLGVAVLTLFWGTAFSRNNATTIVANSSLSFPMALILYVLASFVPLHSVVLAAIPFVEVCFLWKLTPIPYSQRREIPIFNSLDVRRMPLFLVVGGSSILLGIMRGLMQDSVFHLLNQAGVVHLALPASVSGLVFFGGILILCAIGLENHWYSFIRPIIPFIGVSAMLLSGSHVSFASLAFFFFGYYCLEVLAWSLCGNLSQEFRLSPVFVFGLGQGGLLLGMLFDVVLSRFKGELFGFLGIVPDYGSALTAFACLLAAYLLLPQEKMFTRIIPRHRRQHPDAANDINAATGYEDKREPNGETDGNSKRQGFFRMRCEEIADRYLLSRRETEVLFLLAKGHNAAFIHDTLVISQGTAKAHIAHIYRKLNIHTQQELLVMMERHAGSGD